MKKAAILSLSFVLIAFAGYAQRKIGNTKKEKKVTTMTVDTITTASGLKYFITQKGTGVQAKKGDNVLVHYTGKLMNDTVFDSSYKRNQPFKFKLGQGMVIKGWDEGIALLKVGDKATFIIPANLAYGPRANGNIPANSILKFDVELMEVKEPIIIKPFDVAGKDTVTTASGLKYIKVKSVPEGIQASSGKMVAAQYTGYLLDGTKFDSSVERDSPHNFQLGVGQVIPGWDEGIALLKVGEKARLIIPANLAYGAQGAGGIIPPNATIVFDVELMKVQ